MSITSGFFNSLNHDRKYDASQMSSIFDGIIEDGVFETIGNALTVSCTGNDRIVTVGTGRAWYDHTWTLNDAPYPLEIAASSSALNRIDAVVLNIGTDETIRENTIIVVTGVPATEPVRPTLAANQHALAYIRVNKDSPYVLASDITNVVGTSETPFITGTMHVLDIDDLTAQWSGQFNEWLIRKRASFDEWFESIQWEIEPEDVTRIANDIVLLKRKHINVSNYAVEKSAWVDQSAEGGTPYIEDYPWRAPITIQGIDSNYSASVVLNYPLISEGIYAPVTTTADNTVFIYASEQPEPENGIVIPVVICTYVPNPTMHD